jgi:hypothetical protein
VTREQVRSQVGDAALVVRRYAAHQHPGRLVAAGHHRLLFDIGRCGDDAGKLRDSIELRAPIRNAALETGDGGMRREAQDSRAQLLFETVHDREDDDEHGDSESEPQNGDARDQRHEAALGRRAQIPKP